MTTDTTRDQATPPVPGAAAPAGPPPAPNYVDLLFHRMHAVAPHPDSGFTIGVALHLQGPAPEPERIRDRVAALLPALPALTHLLRQRPPAWVPAAPDLERHITVRPLPTGPGPVAAALEELLREPLPTDAPPWRMVLLRPESSDSSDSTAGTDGTAESILVYLTHHGLQDGGSLISVLETLFGPPLRPSQLSVTARLPRLRRGDTRRGIPTLLDGGRAHRVWDAPGRPLSTGRRLLWAEVPLRRLREAARAGGCGANDIHLAALGHAVAGWAAERWPPADGVPLPVFVPVSLRTPEEAVLPGNRCVPVRVDLPGGPRTAALRLAGTVFATAPLRSVAHRAFLHRFVTALPTWLHLWLVRWGTGPGRASIGSSFLLMRHRLTVGDARTVRVVPLMFCPDATPMTVSLIAYAGIASVCFRIDRALPGAETLPDRWVRAVEELAAAGEPG
ncbi:hypothetical protein [Streptomyces yaizuensis]|uniref:Wax ester/triacylglycerol synthase family O-acyltransferase n=1 Tax=Streptomyces yaizuensis TaxID=2989713 RepID=A0ABQ5P0B2_9ACTN|nr:hypothetical protein [Streptomyces sp. YSPA8]GLF95661.1 wax ester/triacylglycerol synthase family O-acyltransferase [Streptomyces sp. YSPA8]